MVQTKYLTVEEELESPCTVSRSVLIKDKLNGRPWGKKVSDLESNCNMHYLTVFRTDIILGLHKQWHPWEHSMGWRTHGVIC